MEPKNLVIFMSDEHTRSVTGCYGHNFIHTPNIDWLASTGTKFDAAYTTCPVCVPARAGFATGRYVHEIGAWDNATPFTGADPNWHALLRARGHQTVSIGKLHFRSNDDDNGFADEQIAMHIIDGKGDLLGLIRDEDTPKRGASWKMAKMAGPGESMYTRYDRDIAAAAQTWIFEEAPKYKDKPWVLFVSLVAPHFPLTAPSEHFYRYYNRDLAPPKLYDKRTTPIHPYIDEYRKIFAYDEHFEDMDKVKRAQAGYLGLITFMDQQVGLVIQALEDAELMPDTRILYTSDHGDNMGTRGAWGKSVMYEEAAAVPLIIAGDDLLEGHAVKTPVDFNDIYPFIMKCVGAADNDTIAADMSGTCLADIADGAESDRIAFSEYHGMGSKVAAFLIRRGDFKFVHYEDDDYPDQLFNLADDPDELNDLVQAGGHQNVIVELMADLHKVCNPAAVDAAARETQARMIVANGGKDAIIKRGDLGFSVPPGVTPMFD